MIRNLLSTFMCLTTFAMMANAQNYSFSKKTETYSSITGGSPITRNINLGFDITIDGVKSDTLFTSEYFGQIGTQKPLQFYGFYADVQDGNQTYKVTGSPGNRIVKLQYDKVKFAHNNWGPDYVTFQIWIFEKDNALELHMGASSISDPTLDYYFHTPAGPGVGFEKMWLKGSTSNPAIDTPDETYLNGTPASGQVYRFAPVTTSINTAKKQQNNIQLYPNPGSSNLNITVEHKGKHYVTIYDMLQRKVLQQPLYTEFNTINISRLQTGNYTIQVSDESRVLSTFKYHKQ